MPPFRTHRETLNLSIRALALRANVTPQTVVTIEQGRGRPQAKTMAKLAGALHVEIGEIDEFVGATTEAME